MAKQHKFTILIPGELHKRIKQEAKKEYTSMANYIRSAIKKALENK